MVSVPLRGLLFFNPTNPTEEEARQFLFPSPYGDYYFLTITKQSDNKKTTISFRPLTGIIIF